jgi:hypothetical protein
VLQKRTNLTRGSFTSLLDDGIINGIDLNALTYQENILDNPLIITRAALYVYLNAMVSLAIRMFQSFG